MRLGLDKASGKSLRGLGQRSKKKKSLVYQKRRVKSSCKLRLVRGKEPKQGCKAPKVTVGRRRRW